MRCEQPGCTGQILDGYCDVCGMPGRSTSASGGPFVPADGSHCHQPGCPGRIRDGYCDVCGSPASGPAPTVEPATSTVRTSATLGSMAMGSARIAAFGQRPQRQSRPDPDAARIGAGLTRVPPAPEIDPVKAVLANPQVPLASRVCARCGTPVGQGAGGVATRSEGFCPNCGAPYSFTVKLHPGDVVAGQYEVVGALAHGGMGWVHLARDRNVSGRLVVLKGLLNSRDQEAATATINEQRYLARVEHPMIVEIHNFVTHNDAAYIVMEYVGGRSLKQLLKQRRATNHDQPNPLPVDQGLAFLIEILPALEYLHSMGLVYCDFKPDNVIQVGDSLKLIDLGGVRHLADDESPIYGTLGFQAPEVATSGASVASDLYTVGRTLLVLCADVPGYQTEYEHTLPPPEQIPAIVEHDALYRLLQRCCATDPNDRFGSANELRDQMLGVLRQVVAQQRGTPAVTAVGSELFEPPPAASITAGVWQLPRLRLEPGEPTHTRVAAGYRALADAEVVKVAELAQQLLDEDPWEWRAIWLTGLDALLREDPRRAQHAFNSVYGQIPGELGPKLALALACELGDEPELAQRFYLDCALTDANYVTAAAFGLYRVRLAQGDLDAALQALDLVPKTSRGYPEAQRQRLSQVLRTATDPNRIDQALTALAQGPLDDATRARYRAGLYLQAEQLAGTGTLPLQGEQLTAATLRARRREAYLELARIEPDPAQRAIWLDQANELRPWSLW